MQNKLKFYREQKNITQKELAKKVGITERNYQQLEYQKHEPKISTAQRLAKELGVDIYKLFPIED